MIAAISGGAVASVIATLITASKEKRQWLRNAKFKAYSGLSKDLITLGNLKPGGLTIWEFRSLSAESLLFIKDTVLVETLVAFLGDLNSFRDRWLSAVDCGDPYEAREDLSQHELPLLIDRARKIVLDLGDDIRNT